MAQQRKKPLNWDFCINCNGTLTPEQIADNYTFCPDCMEEING